MHICCCFFLPQISQDCLYVAHTQYVSPDTVCAGRSLVFLCLLNLSSTFPVSEDLSFLKEFVLDIDSRAQHLSHYRWFHTGRTGSLKLRQQTNNLLFYSSHRRVQIDSLEMEFVLDELHQLRPLYVCAWRWLAGSEALMAYVLCCCVVCCAVGQTHTWVLVWMPF